MIYKMYWSVTVLGMIALGLHSLILFQQLRQRRTRRSIRRQQHLPISSKSSLDH